MGSVPSTRWVLKQAADTSALSLVHAACVRHGGFVSGAQRFDSRAFGLSPAEAGAMDPQQRLLLERGYEALHGAGLSRRELLGSTIAVSVGQWESEFASVIVRTALGRSVYASTGSPASRIGLRLSGLAVPEAIARLQRQEGRGECGHGGTVALL